MKQKSSKLGNPLLYASMAKQGATLIKETASGIPKPIIYVGAGLALFVAYKMFSGLSKVTGAVTDTVSSAGNLITETIAMPTNALKKISNTIGLTDSKERVNAKKTIDFFLKSDAGKNAFSINYKDKKEIPNGAKLITVSRADFLAKEIEKSFGYTNDDENRIYATIKTLDTRVKLSQVSRSYYKIYRKDLLFRLIDKLSPEEFMVIVNHVNSIKNY